ncbi:MAG: PAS domain-containing protein [Nitratireductor sp.]|nr:PAS domain-containing protein [Nitratireductor sp.]
MDNSGKHRDLDRLAYESAPIGIVLTENRIIRACNPEFARMFGFDRDALIDQSFAILYPSFEEFERIRNIGVQPLRETGGYSDERVMARADGTLFWCRVRGRTLTTEGDPLAKAVWSIADLSQTRPMTQLSTRERQIMMHLIDGRTSKEIAKILAISPRTVETYRGRLLSKFGAANVVELMTRVASMPT